MNSITEFLDLEDSNITIESYSISGTVKTITLSTPAVPHFCPLCANRMYSRGIKERKIQHPILQDGYQIILILHQRRWRCQNNECRYETNEEFNFVAPRKRCTNASEMLIVQAFRDFSTPAAEIARRFNTSDTHVMDVFDKYVHLARLPLTDIISIDEVCIDMDAKCRYALVIQDFRTGDPIDLLISRRSDTTEPYFANLPLEERAGVKYLISDMYDPYINYVAKYFPNAVPVVDSFHVVQWMLHKIELYYRELLKRYKNRDRQRYLDQHPEGLKDWEKIPVSDEVYIHTKFRWIIMLNQSRVRYHSEARMDRRLHCMMNTYDYEDYLFRIDDRLKTLRELKEMYIRFNNNYGGNPEIAALELDKLIEKYRSSKDSIFIDFAGTLERNRNYIINSFVMIKKNGPGGLYDARLSNGPIESLNRTPKDMIRNGRGYRNFDHFRNRFLYATRNNPVLDGTGRNVSTLYDMEDDF